ncbi:MAG: hypothetical protein JWM74_4443 [Myxococcaceae bacterium]|nr:hypothetical protein [Myxococcaceae bacterium]
MDGHGDEADVNVKRVLVRVWRTIRYLLLRATSARGPRRKLVLFAGILAIVAWQWGFALHDAKVDDTYRNTAASGMHNDVYFVYYLWYEGLFPVVSTKSYIPCDHKCAPVQESMAPTALTHEAAESLLKTEGRTLQMDSGWTWYAGDRGKVFLYMLDVWLKGAPWKPSVKPFHRFVWIVALCGLFFSFWRARRPWLGALCVLFVGSDPFQLYEVHARENVFGWSITTAVLLLAIHLPLLTSKRIDPRWAFAWPIATALLMSTIRTFRSEPMPMLAGALLAYMFARFTGVRSNRETWLRRGALVATFFAFFFVGHTFWTRFFLAKQAQATQVVTKLGGHPYPGNVRMYHHFWHPVWCGLGDFDKKYGYVWDDTRALAYAKPILENKFHQHVPSPYFSGTAKSLDEYWDADGIYKKLPYDIENYNEIIRDKVLDDIKHDPKWFAGIMYKRVERVLTEATPIRISTRTGWLDVPWMTGKLFLPLLVLLFVARAKFASKLLVFTLPSLTTALIVYCDRGIHWYGIFHLFMAAILVMIAVEIARLGYARYRRHARERAAA